MPGSVSDSHKIGGQRTVPRNSRVRENCCIDSNNRDVARRLISVRWLGDNWGVILPTREFLTVRTDSDKPALRRIIHL